MLEGKTYIKYFKNNSEITKKEFIEVLTFVEVGNSRMNNEIILGDLTLIILGITGNCEYSERGTGLRIESNRSIPSLIRILFKSIQHKMYCESEEEILKTIKENNKKQIAIGG